MSSDLVLSLLGFAAALAVLVGGFVLWAHGASEWVAFAGLLLSVVPAYLPADRLERWAWRRAQAQREREAASAARER